MEKLLIFLLLFPTIFTQECTKIISPQVRSFSSIIEYQENKAHFDPKAPEYAGNSVEFSLDSINRLVKNIFVTYDSQHIVKLDMSCKQIEEIDEGAFASLDCLNVLILNHNNITQLSRDVFQGLDKLENLDLSRNAIKNLPDLVFTRVIRLKTLDLSGNRIKKLEAFSFFNLTNLEILNVGFNELVIIEEETFQSLTNLKSLNLEYNKLRDIEPENWKGLKNLEVLNLAGNYLESFDPNYEFSFKNLKSLNLSSNYLTELNGLVLKIKFPQLGLMDLNDNEWLCHDLVEILRTLADSKILTPGNGKFDTDEKGIKCHNVDIPAHKPPTETPSTTPASVIGTTSPPRNYLDTVLMDNKKLMAANDEILRSISVLRDLTIFMFVLLILFVLFEVIVKTNCWRIVSDIFRGGNEMYYDNSNVENFRLLHR